MRTPIMFKLPGVIKPEMNNSTLVSNIDLVPTVLQLLDITEYELPGVDILDREKLNEREALFIECYNDDILNTENPSETVLYKVAINEKWKLILPNTKMLIRDFKTSKDQYYGYYSNQPQLFDLKNDSAEQVNLAKEYPKIVATMSHQIDEWWQPAD